MNHGDRHRSVLRDLRELADIHPDAESTARAIARAGTALKSSETIALSPRKSRLPLRSAFAIAAALFVVGFLTHWWVPSQGTSSLAFGQVQRQVARTKSVQYRQTRRDRTSQGKAAPEEERKVMILGSHLKREEVRITTAGDPLPAGEKWGTGPKHYVMIYDAKSGKMIDLFPDTKSYSIPRDLLGIDPESGNVYESKIEAAPEFDFYQHIRAVPVGKAEKLSKRRIDGKLAAGFQIVEQAKRPKGTDTWTRKYWVDPETKLPVRIEISFRSTQPRMVATDFVQRDFQFDAPLDESLFSTEPPEGYHDISAP